MNHVRTTLNQLLLKSEVSYLPVDLEKIIRRNGWEVASIEKDHELLYKLGFSDYSKKKDSFAVNADTNQKVIFLSDALPSFERILAMAHEITHCALGHKAVKVSLATMKTPKRQRNWKQRQTSGSFIYWRLPVF